MAMVTAHMLEIPPRPFLQIHCLCGQRCSGWGLKEQIPSLIKQAMKEASKSKAGTSILGSMKGHPISAHPHMKQFLKGVALPLLIYRFSMRNLGLEILALIGGPFQAPGNSLIQRLNP